MTPEQAAAYLAANPDVKAAFDANSYGLTPEQFAQTHYDTFVATGIEKRPLAPPPPSDQQAEAYAAQNPDVAQAANRVPGTRVDQLAVVKDHMTTHAAAEQRPIPTEAQAVQILNPGSVAAQQAAGTYVKPQRAGLDEFGRTKQTATVEGQNRGEAYAGEDPAAIAARREAAITPAQRAEAERDAARKPMRDWMSQIEAQPWYKDFAALGSNGAQNPWSFDIRSGKSHNRVNALVDRYGTFDPREYAAKNGLPPPPGAWESDPAKWQRDTSVDPFVARRAEVASNKAQAKASHEAPPQGILGAAARAQAQPAAPAKLGEGLLTNSRTFKPLK